MEPWFILFLVVCTGVNQYYTATMLKAVAMLKRRLNTNLKNVFGNMTNILSVSVRYFIDYNIIKKILNLCYQTVTILLKSVYYLE
jgi:hypothetical protein